MARQILEHCPSFLPGNGKRYIVAQNDGWHGFVTRWDWVHGVLGGGTPVDSYQLESIRGSGGMFSWWEYVENMQIEFREQAAPIAFLELPEPEPAAQPEPVHLEPKKRGRPKKADK